MTIEDTNTYNAQDEAILYFISDEMVHDFSIKYAMYEEVPKFQSWSQLPAKNDFVRVKFEHVVDDNIEGGVNNQMYQVFVNGEHAGDFFGNQIDVPVGNIDRLFDIEVFATPHENFPRKVPSFGSNMDISFTSYKSSLFDINRTKIFYDNATGTYEAQPIVEIDSLSEGSGRLFYKLETINKKKTYAFGE